MSKGKSVLSQAASERNRKRKPKVNSARGSVIGVKLSGATLYPSKDSLGIRGSDKFTMDTGASANTKYSSADVYLGGRNLLPGRRLLETEEDYIRLIRRGIRKTSLDHLIAATNIPEVEMVEILQTTSKELQSIKPDALLGQDQTEKVVNIARLYALGEEVFGTAEEFSKWMNGKVASLGNKRPKEYLDTTSGINLLMDEIGRMQHGVYS